MRNFDFLKDTPQLKTLYGFCNNAEEYQAADPDKSALNARRALEWLVKAIYFLNKYEAAERASLYELVDDEQFKGFLGNDRADLMKRLHYIRKTGNIAAHQGGVTRREAFFSVLNLHAFVAAVLRKVGLIDGDVAEFDGNLIPKNPEPTLYVEPKEIKVEKEAAELLETSNSRTLGISESRNLELSNSQSLELSKDSTLAADCAQISEAETRKLFIDMMLKEAGWRVLNQNGAILPSCACVEVRVEKGFADYVLFGANGKPLAVVEAKRTSKDASVGRHQAELYADCLERKYGVRPVIYFSNGYQTFVIDGLYPAREVFAYHTEEELQLLIQRRGRKDITDIKVNDDITNREYQKRAVRAVCEHFNAKRRKALLVMATGTGKTRTAISLVDILTRNAWVKNVLFLADRTALVSQAHKNFAKLLPQMTYCVLSENGKDGDKDARITLSTYQTMINYIDAEEKDFSVGRFDLIIVDEAHRSVFGKYGSIFDYFDSLLIGLTATPREDVDRSTYQLFEMEEGEPNFAYELEEAVADGYLSPYQAFRKGSAVLNRGIRYDELSAAEKEQLEKVWAYEAALQNLETSTPRNIENSEIFKYIYNEDTVDKMLQDLMRCGQRVDGGERLGKTIVFAANHAHAELIVKRFGKLYPELGADFCQLIDNTVNYAQDLINRFEIRGGMPQIAVSVDMLDVGIDIPDILNLVFFKAVKSKIKFWQMIGRGTRLSEHIFGEGQHKTCFHIYDWCGNFDYFSLHENGVSAAPSASLTEKLFGLKLDIAVELQNAKYQGDAFAKAMHDGFKEELHGLVAGLNDARIEVRKNWAVVDAFRKAEAWVYVSPIDALSLKENVAPLLVNSLEDANVKRFDSLTLLVELNLLINSSSRNLENSKIQNLEVSNNRPSEFSPKAARACRNIIAILQALQERASIPQIQAKMNVINEMLAPQFWEDLSLSKLERLRTEIRELIHFLEGQHGQTFIVDVEDEVEDGGEIDVTFTPMSYKQRVFDYLAQHRDLPILKRIRRIEQLTKEDIAELERILWQELGSKAEYDKYVRQMLCGSNVGVFIRSIVGVDRSEALKLFSDFISGGVLNSRQEEYLKTIITYVCANGDIDTDTITNVFPFADYDWIETFGPHTASIGKYVTHLHSVIYA